MEIYRLILKTPRPGSAYPDGNSYDTGATYAGCSQDNTAPCDPQQFLSEEDAIAYANQRGEVPIRVRDVTQTWNILNGDEPITDDMLIKESGLSLSGMNPLLLGALVIGGLLFVTSSRRGKGGEA